jgi:hypothetical protein
VRQAIQSAGSSIIQQQSSKEWISINLQVNLLDLIDVYEGGVSALIKMYK